jgi:hypothetical protein
VERWIDISCFTQSSATNTNGNSAQNIIRGPDFFTVDVGLHKEFSLGERFRVQLRGEAFNVLNRVNLLGPSLNYFVAAPNSSAGITRARDGRDIQLGLRLIF